MLHVVWEQNQYLKDPEEKSCPFHLTERNPSKLCNNWKDYNNGGKGFVQVFFHLLSLVPLLRFFFTEISSPDSNPASAVCVESITASFETAALSRRRLGQNTRWH